MFFQSSKKTGKDSALGIHIPHPQTSFGHTIGFDVVILRFRLSKSLCD